MPRTLSRLMLSLALAGGLACSGASSSTTGSGATGAGGTSTGSAGSTGTAGATTGGPGQAGDTGGSGQAGATSSGAGGTPGGSGAAGNASTGAAGNASGGAGGSTGAAGAAGGTSGAAGAAGGSSGAAGNGFEPGDTPPWRPLMITATKAEHLHGSAGVDTRATSLGKLAVTLGVSSGQYSSWLGKRGYHVIGASFGECNAPNLGAGRDAVGTCRLGEWAMVSAQVKSTLTSFATMYQTEDWGYFLNQDGSVRWSDVAFTGVSHGATTAEIIGRLGARVWRVVSCAGPRDNTCGTGMLMTATYDPANPPYNVNCPLADIASWLDKPTMTPMDRFYGLEGTTDVEFGDIMFNMMYTKYPGVPTQWNVPNPVLDGQHQFYSTVGGHLDFLNAANTPVNTDAVLNLAFAIPVANQNPTF